MSDVRYAVRALCRIPGITALSIVTLGLGIFATTTTFSAVYAALLRPIPFAQPERVGYLHTTRHTPGEGLVRLRWSYALAGQIRTHAAAYASMATFTRTSVTLGADRAAEGSPEQVDGEVVSAGYFETLRVAPSIGRVFAVDEEGPGHPVAVISDGLWRARYGRDPQILSRRLTVNGVPLVIVGVMPAGFEGVSGHAVVWIPAGMAPLLTYRDYLTTSQLFINLIGRLEDRVSFQQANAELATLAEQLPLPAPVDGTPAVWSASVIPLGDARIDPRQRRALLLLLAGSAGVLLVACMNVTLLLLARARGRRGEIAVRVALGASGGQVARQVLAESTLVAAGGGMLGTLLAAWGIAWLRLETPPLIPSTFNAYGQIASFSAPAIDPISLMSAAAIAALAAVLAGLAPALLAARADPASALSQTSRAVAGRGLGSVMSVLVVTQIGVAVLMLAGALLLTRTVHALQGGESGFDGGALSFWINAPASRYPDSSGPSTVERLLDRITQVPGVHEAGVNRCTPYGASCARSVLFIAGRSTRPQDAPPIERHYVSSGYFRAAGIALKRGRLIGDDDRADRPPVVVINETAARRFWPGEDPIGKRVWFGGGSAFMDPAHALEVVGVVADVKYWPVNEPVGPDFYTSYQQFVWPSSMYIIKVTDAAVVLPAIRRAVAEIDPALAVYDVRRVDERAAEAVAPARFIASLTALFALSSAALAALGVFGVMAYSVSMRRDELALRIALGASPAALNRDVLGRAAALALTGSGIGIVLALWLLPVTRTMLYGVSPFDPVTLGSAVVGMTAIALLSAVVPAARARAVDPLTILRS
jgi:putative ABC transport system permease protein